MFGRKSDKDQTKSPTQSPTHRINSRYPTQEAADARAKEWHDAHESMRKEIEDAKERMARSESSSRSRSPFWGREKSPSQDNSAAIAKVAAAIAPRDKGRCKIS